MNEQYLKNVIEAALLAAGKPLAALELRELFDEFERPELGAVQEAINALAADYENRGIELREVASGWRIQVRDAVAAPVSRLWQERPAKYSRAFLETLALIAYRQPITRGEIEEIRGVAVNPNIVKTLTERGWVRVVGHREVPGRPELLGTTREFLDYFGLRSLDDLPTLAQLRDIETLGVQLEFGATAAPAREAADVQGAPGAAGDTDGAGGDAAAAEDGDDATAAEGGEDASVDTGALEPASEAELDGDAEADAEADAFAEDSTEAVAETTTAGTDGGDADEGDATPGTTRAAPEHAGDENEREPRELVAAGNGGPAVREPRD